MAHRFPGHMEFTAFPVLFFFCLTIICVFICTSDCIEIVYELPLLSNNTASETFLQKSEAVERADWIFITGVPA